MKLNFLPSLASMISSQPCYTNKQFLKKKNTLSFMDRHMAESLNWISCYKDCKASDSESKKAHTRSRAVRQKRCYYLAYGPGSRLLHALERKVTTVIMWKLSCQIYHAGNCPKVLRFWCDYCNIPCSVITCNIIFILLHSWEAFVFSFSKPPLNVYSSVI